MPNLTAPETETLYAFTRQHVEFGEEPASLFHGAASSVSLSTKQHRPLLTVKKSTGLGWFGFGLWAKR